LILSILLFSVLLETRVIPPGQPLFIPPSMCETSMQSWDNTGDGTVDELRFVMDEECNLQYEDKLKKKEKIKKIKYEI